jgi:hypothetical protein
MGKRSFGPLRAARKIGKRLSRAVLLPLEDRVLFSTINVSNYGAIPNDGVNDLLAIQTALNASRAGDTILFSGGTFNLSNFSLQQRNSNGFGMIFPGDRTYLGQNGATLSGSDSRGPLVYLQSYSGSSHVPTNNVTISHLNFVGGGIYIDSSSGFNDHIVLDYNTFNLTTTNGDTRQGLTFTSGLSNARITNNYFTGYNGGFGIYGYNYNTLTIANNEFVNVQAGMHIDAFYNSGNLLVEQNYVTGAKGMGMEFQSTATNLVFQDNWFEHPNLSSNFSTNNNSFAYSLILDKSSNIIIRRNVVIAPERPDGVGCRVGFEAGGDNSLVEDNYVNGINNVLAINDAVGTCNVTVRNNQFMNYLEPARLSFPSSNPLRTWTNINNGPNTVLSATMRDRIARMAKPGIGDKRYGDPLPDLGGASGPAAPGNLTGNSLGTGQMELSWFDGSDDEDGFEVQLLGSDGITWQTIATVGTNVTNVTVSNVPDGDVLRVVAFNANGYSSGSNSITVTSLPGTPTDIFGTALTANSIQLSWKDNSANETDFQIQMLSADGSAWLTIGTSSPNVPTYTVTGLAAGQSYAFRVVAHNSTGYSPESVATQVRTPMPESGSAPTRRARAVLIYQGSSSTAVTPSIGASS